MTRILHVLDHSLPLQSGYSFRTRAIMKAQRDAGHDSRGLTGQRQQPARPVPDGARLVPDAGAGPASAPLAPDGGLEWHDGLPFYRTDGRPAGVPGAREWREIAALTEAILRVCAQWRPAVLHAHSPGLCGLAALRAARRLGIPLVYEIRAFWEDAALANAAQDAAAPRLAARARYRLTRALENHVVARADAVMTICHGLRDDLIARGTAPHKIGVMPNGVDLTLFGQTGAPPPDADGATIGFFGSFYAYEGLDTLIDAMPLLLRDHPHTRLLLIGSGPQSDAVRRKAVGSPAAHAITCLGPVPHSAIAAHYAQCSIMVYPRKACRLTELVTPLKPLEAMAQGVLVAASDIGGHRELIVPGVTGELFAPGNPAACAEALSQLLHNRAAWPAMRAAASNRIHARHDWAQNAARYEPLYQWLQQRRSAHAPPPTARASQPFTPPAV